MRVWVEKKRPLYSRKLGDVEQISFFRESKELDRTTYNSHNWDSIRSEKATKKKEIAEGEKEQAFMKEIPL